MAKKTRKKAAKARSDRGQIVIPLSKPKKLSRSQSTMFKSIVDLMSLAANQIVKKIIEQIELTIQASGKQIANGSFAEWRPELLKSVRNNLALNAKWDAITEATVLQVAADMGTVAVILAGTSNTVAKAQIHAAFNAVSQAHTTCSSILGGGSWCSFEM